MKRRGGNTGSASTRTSSAGDCITILATRPGKLATKRFVKTDVGVEKVDYNAGVLFGVLEPYFVHDIYEVSALLSALEGLPNCLVIRGVPRDPARAAACWIERTGSGSEGNFETPPQGHRWILIDFDKIEVPPQLSLKTDTVAVCENLVHLLPAEFHGASYHWSLSSSAGMGDPSRVSMHLWFWLTRPTPDAALKAWAKAIKLATGRKLVDDALFQHVQAHYTAAPIFEGLTDPFPTRSGLVEKAEPAVDLVVGESAGPSLKKRTVGAKPASPSAHAGAGFEYHLSLIGDHAGGDGFHVAIVAAAASYVGTHGAEGTDVEQLYEILSKAVFVADSTHHDDAAYIAQMASREHIIPAIESALRKFGSQPPDRHKPRVHDGVKPYFESVTMSVSDAERLLTEIANSGQ